MADRKKRTDAATCKRYGIWTALLGIVVTCAFVLFPGFDLVTAKWFYSGNNQFVLSTSTVGAAARIAFKMLFIAASIVILVGLMASALGYRIGIMLGFPVWLFLTCTLVVGPGLIANTVFKDNWGRARPYQMEQFGGDKRFSVVFKISDECHKNCSFFAGESSSIFALFFALAFSIRSQRRPLVAIGIVAGVAAGTMRMAQGGHFISDVMISGIVMMLVVLAMYWLFFIRFYDAFDRDRALPLQGLATIALAGFLIPARVQVAIRQRR